MSDSIFKNLFGDREESPTGATAARTFGAFSATKQQGKASPESTSLFDKSTPGPGNALQFDSTLTKNPSPGGGSPGEVNSGVQSAADSQAYVDSTYGPGWRYERPGVISRERMSKHGPSTGRYEWNTNTAAPKTAGNVTDTTLEEQVKKSGRKSLTASTMLTTGAGLYEDPNTASQVLLD